MNDQNDWEGKKYLASDKVIATVVIIITIAIILVAFKLITGDYVPALSGPIGL